MKSVILSVMLMTPEVTNSTLQGCSWLLGFGTIHNDLLILGFADPSESKAENLRLYRALTPKPDGTFDLELAVVLREFLPNNDGRMEYYLDVTDAGQIKRLYVSNNMVKIRYKTIEGTFHVLVPRSSEAMLIGTETNPIPNGAHCEFQKTMVSCRFAITGSDAEDALSSSLEECMDSFVRHLNKIIAAHMMLGDQTFLLTAPVYERDSFDSMYMALQGSELGGFVTERIGTNLARCILNPPNLTRQTAETLLPYLTQETALDTAILFLRSSKSYLDGGLTSYALLQLAIAAEIATTRYVHERLISKGVSKTKLKLYEKDITFSQMLNIYVPALTPQAKMPKSTIMGRINRARELRNQLMHEGSTGLKKTEVRQLYEAAKEYIDALAAISN